LVELDYVAEGLGECGSEFEGVELMDGGVMRYPWFIIPFSFVAWIPVLNLRRCIVVGIELLLFVARLPTMFADT